MIRHMRHGSSPRLMALQSILSPNRRESLPAPSAGDRITPDERIALTRLSRSPSAPAAQVEPPRALLAIGDGASYTATAHQVGRRHNETISAWVSRFNRKGLADV